MKLFLIPLALLLATPLRAETAQEEAPHVFELAGMEILHPWTRAGNGDTALVFMRLHNEGDGTITLTGARSEGGASGGLVGFRMQDGDMVAEPIAEFPVAPGQEIELTPDGLALRLDGVAQPRLEGGHWNVVLQTSAGELAVEIAVEDSDALDHGHAGHAH